jgi:hypothetical protein
VAPRCNTGCATHLSCLLIFFGNFSEGLSEAQNGYIFCMLLGQVALTGTFQAQLCYVGLDFNEAELETCQFGPPASAAAA